MFSRVPQDQRLCCRGDDAYDYGSRNTQMWSKTESNSRPKYFFLILVSFHFGSMSIFLEWRPRMIVSHSPFPLHFGPLNHKTRLLWRVRCLTLSQILTILRFVTWHDPATYTSRFSKVFAQKNVVATQTLIEAQNIRSLPSCTPFWTHWNVFSTCDTSDRMERLASFHTRVVILIHPACGRTF